MPRVHENGIQYGPSTERTIPCSICVAQPSFNNLICQKTVVPMVLPFQHNFLRKEQ